MLFWARSKEIRELFYIPHYRLFPIAIKPQRDRSRKRVVRCSVPSSSLLTSPYCSLRLQAERPPGKTVVKSKGYLFPHRTKSFPTSAESCLKIKFNLYLNNLFKPLAPHRVRRRFIPFLCGLAIIWLIMVARGPAEEWKIDFLSHFWFLEGYIWCGPSCPCYLPTPRVWLRCRRATLHPTRVRAAFSIRSPARAAWSTLQCRTSAKVQQILFLYLRKEIGIICASVLGFWWWHEEAIQDVWPSKCTVMHTSHLFSE